MPRLVTKQTFWGQVQIGSQEECWTWLGGVYSQRGGYGRTRWGGKQIKAHRLAYLLTHGELPNSLDVLHTCDNPRCCNPYHLYAGTDAENAKDRVERNRQCKGETRPLAKLTNEDVRRIRQDTMSSGKDLAKRFSVSEGLISGIRNGTRWKHLG